MSIRAEKPTPPLRDHVNPIRRRPLVRIRNIHERIIDADPADIAPLLATLGQPDDALYPPLWEPMRFDKPVGVGASGTHGTISAYEPGSLIEITFPSATGITGTHIHRDKSRPRTVAGSA